MTHTVGTLRGPRGPSPLVGVSYSCITHTPVGTGTGRADRSTGVVPLAVGSYYKHDPFKASLPVACRTIGGKRRRPEVCEHTLGPVAHL